MTTANIHTLIVLGFLALLAIVIGTASVLNTRTRSREHAQVAASRAREAYWRAQEYEDVPEEEPGEDDGEPARDRAIRGLADTE
jgi:hypothetical protein